MAKVRFTSHLVRHRPLPGVEAEGADVAEVLAAVFAGDDLLRHYVLDDQGRVADRIRMTDKVGPQSEIYVLQALSGG